MRQREMPSAPHSLFFSSVHLDFLTSDPFSSFPSFGSSVDRRKREEERETSLPVKISHASAEGEKGGGEAPPEIECRAKERGSRG